MKRQQIYTPMREDWLFHVLLPLAAYTVLAISSLATGSSTIEALFAVGMAVLFLLISGIHNAWDAIAYHVLVDNRDSTSVRE
jgi:hypothetical protein